MKREAVQSRIKAEDKKIIDSYIEKKNITKSDFIRETLLEKINSEK